MSERQHVLIVGGGVIGLSIAISLLDHPEKSYDVTLIAADLPDLDCRMYSPSSRHGINASPAVASYASAWAGAHHVSDASEGQLLVRDKRTFDVLTRLDEQLRRTAWGHKGSQPFFWGQQIELCQKGANRDEASLRWYPAFEEIWHVGNDDLKYGCKLETFNFVVPRYLPMLFAYMLSLGGKALRRKVSSLCEAIRLASPGEDAPEFLTLANDRIVGKPAHQNAPSLVIATPGLGAKQLLCDDKVHPVRGQTLLVRAPWCSAVSVVAKYKPEGQMKNSSSACKELEWCGLSCFSAKMGGRDTYVIPRGNGTFIVGGTRISDDWDTEPRPDTTEEILRRVLPLVPSLAKPDARLAIEEALRASAAEADSNAPRPHLASLVDIIDVNVGLRPGRHGGMCIERASPEDAKRLTDGLPLVYSYGFGGTGYQSSWGAAFETRDLVDEALARTPASKGSFWRQLVDGRIAIPAPETLVANAEVARKGFG